MFTKQEIINADNYNLNRICISLKQRIISLNKKKMTYLAIDIQFKLSLVKNEITERILLGEWYE